MYKKYVIFLLAISYLFITSCNYSDILDYAFNMNNQSIEVVNNTEVEVEIEIDTYFEYAYGEKGVTLIRYIGREIRPSIPSLVNGEKVIEIEDECFSDLDFIEYVTISQYVERIGEKAFTNCTSLLQVNMSNNVESIGSEAFKGCTNLRNITLSDRLITLGISLFEDCYELSSIIMPKLIKLICTNAFANCISLKQVSWYRTPTIAKDSFLNCINLDGPTFLKIQDANPKAYRVSEE